MAWKEMQAEFQTYTETRATLARQAAQVEADAGTDPVAMAAAALRVADVAGADAFMRNRLLFDIAGSLDSLSFCYRKILEMQQERTRPANQPGPARR